MNSHIIYSIWEACRPAGFFCGAPIDFMKILNPGEKGLPEQLS